MVSKNGVLSFVLMVSTRNYFDRSDVMNNFRLLAPHKPVDPSNYSNYIAPKYGAEQIAEQVLSRHTILIGGPSGIGKSTELARTAKFLQRERLTCLVPIDRWENMRQLNSKQLILRMAGRLAYIAVHNLNIPISEELQMILIVAKVLKDDSIDIDETVVVPDEGEVLRRVVSEINQYLPLGKRISFLIDGLDKVPEENSSSQELFEALGALPKSIDLVVIVPWYAIFGPKAASVIRYGEKLIILRALDDLASPNGENLQFLIDILVSRLGINADEVTNNPNRLKFVHEAAKWSGGIPQVFLRLLGDAFVNMQTDINGSWPDVSSITDVVKSYGDGFRRILLPGDTKIINQSVGTDGREIDIKTRIRLMNYNILLERLNNDKPELSIHPIASLVVGS
jgi:hypothetical protein